MAAKIPNDIYQFSILSAYKAGLTQTGPPVRALQGYGSDGIAFLPRNSGELLFLDSTAYLIPPNRGHQVSPTASPDGIASPKQAPQNIMEHAKGETLLPFVMVTKFVPEFSLNISGDTEMESLMDLLECEGPVAGGSNSFMPFRLRGSFASVSLHDVGPSQTYRRSSGATNPSSPAPTSSGIENEKERKLENVKGTIFGFHGPKWAEGISPTGFHCSFLSETAEDGHLRGGRVSDFRADGLVELTWAKSGRFHLGLPTDGKFEELELGGKQDANLLSPTSSH
ncbi:alpha-acetolactate decarboxylase [Venturia nashicola]|uniref:Alpha-acetolactate decarboxylase n=1 Tax=Venturia nashicola TaxID=86259 RepID=A0A4Z1NW70_9PEZI|nr:alpha-acetolactate decarboxylase [Venturia nashicola]